MHLFGKSFNRFSEGLGDAIKIKHLFRLTKHFFNLLHIMLVFKFITSSSQEHQKKV